MSKSNESNEYQKILSTIYEECKKISPENENGLDKDKTEEEEDKSTTESQKDNSSKTNSNDSNNEEKEETIDKEIPENHDLVKSTVNEIEKNDDINSNDSSDQYGEEKDSSGVKIKLRSFASLCSDDSSSSGTSKTGNISNEIAGVSVGDIVQHGNIVESDESGMMHLKISSVVGGEDCITGLAVDVDKDSTIQPSSVSDIEQDSNTTENGCSSSKEPEILAITDPKKNEKDNCTDIVRVCF